MLKATDSAPACATVWESQGCCCGQEVGVQNYHHAGVMEERAVSQKGLLLSPDSHHAKEGVAANLDFLQGTSPAWWQEQTGISSFTLGQQV